VKRHASRVRSPSPRPGFSVGRVHGACPRRESTAKGSSARKSLRHSSALRCTDRRID
jgi:hypothetical protein